MDRKEIILLYKKEIRTRASKMNDKSELLDLLNYVHKLECGDLYKPYSMKRLDFLSNSFMKEEKRYYSFEIPKKSGKTRKISAPSKSLKSIQKTLNIIFECIYKPSKAATGFTNGLSVVDNAIAHVGKNYVLNLDLEDFFPSIQQPRVWARLQVAPFNFSKEVANVIAGLCCMHYGENNSKYGILPQGAPTSPLLTNAICDKLDRRLLGLAKRFNLKYTRYADDITFSSMHNVYSTDGEFWKELNNIIASQNFTINQEKTRLQKAGGRQEVTGIIVSEKPNVTKHYTGFIRIILHVWEKFGRDCAYSRFLTEYLGNCIGSRTTIPSMEEVLRGKLLYMKMVKGDNDSVYQALYQKYNSLISRDCSDNTQSTDNNISYVFSTDLREFEKTFHTKIVFAKNDDKLIAKFHVGDHIMKVSISAKYANLTEPEVRADNDAVISLAKKQGKSFWLLHSSNNSTHTQQITLNLSLSEIFKIWKAKGLDAAIEANFFAGRTIDKTSTPTIQMNNVEEGIMIEEDSLPNDIDNILSIIDRVEDIELF